MSTVHILDVTLRDGSYAVDFAFTAVDTAAICKGLESAGVEYIEIGHGVGMRASGEKYGWAAASDEDYLKAAQGVLTKAKFGMFCIPGVASLEDLDLGRRYGMHFVRIGTNVTEVHQSEDYIRYAKKNELFVAANYMKSYALPPAAFAEEVRKSVSYGVDMVYIVDSAGSMQVDDIGEYYRAVRAVTDVPIGFHGHDNLGLAIANSVAAADIGIEYIDASLQGLGRSAGNASTEVLVAALLKKNYVLPIDLFQLFDVSQKHVRSLLPEKGRAPLDIVCGLAEFHSSYMPHIQKFAAKYSVDPGKLILEVSKVDKINLDLSLLERIAQSLPKSPASLIQYGARTYVGGEQDEK